MPLNFNPDQEIPDLSGTVFFITGGTAGLGASTALHLTKHNASKIYISGRSAPKAEDIIAQARAINASTIVTFIKCDLTSLSAVKAAATEFLTKETQLDVLICNAGIMATPPGLTSDGYEIQFGTNHLGHAMLIRHLLPLLLQHTDESTTESKIKGTNDARIVLLTSVGYQMHPREGIKFNDLRTTQDCGPMWSWRRYGQSKLANILYARELATRYPGVTSVSIHPGVVGTGLVNDMGWLKKVFVYVTNPWSVLDPEEGAYNQVWATTTEKANLINGGYYEPVGVRSKLRGKASDGELAKELWEWTERVLDDF